MPTTERKTLLVADNSPVYLRNLKAMLELEGYLVEEATSPDEAKQKLASCHIDLAVLDKRLINDNEPADISGLDVAKAASELGIPCVVNTHYPEINHTRHALRMRVPRPLALDVLEKGDDRGLIAVIAEALHPAPPPSKPAGLTVDTTRRIVQRNGAPVKLSNRQYALLAHLYQHKDAICTHEELMLAVYNETVPEGQTSADKRLERLVARLREKIEDDADVAQRLITEPGRGYVLVL